MKCPENRGEFVSEAAELRGEHPIFHLHDAERAGPEDDVAHRQIGPVDDPDLDKRVVVKSGAQIVLKNRIGFEEARRLEIVDREVVVAAIALPVKPESAR